MDLYEIHVLMLCFIRIYTLNLLSYQIERTVNKKNFIINNYNGEAHLLYLRSFSPLCAQSLIEYSDLFSHNLNDPFNLVKYIVKWCQIKWEMKRLKTWKHLQVPMQNIKLFVYTNNKFNISPNHHTLYNLHKSEKPQLGVNAFGIKCTPVYIQNFLLNTTDSNMFITSLAAYNINQAYKFNKDPNIPVLVMDKINYFIRCMLPVSPTNLSPKNYSNHLSNAIKPIKPTQQSQNSSLFYPDDNTVLHNLQSTSINSSYSSSTSAESLLNAPPPPISSTTSNQSNFLTSTPKSTPPPPYNALLNNITENLSVLQNLLSVHGSLSSPPLEVLQDITDTDIKEALGNIIFVTNTPNEEQLCQLITNELCSIVDTEVIGQLYQAMNNTLLRWESNIITSSFIKDLFRRTIKQIIYISAPIDLFVGRHEELNVLYELLIAKRQRVVTLYNKESVGKSTLALRFAHANVSHFYGRVIWLNVNNCQSVLVFLRALIKQLDLSNYQNLKKRHPSYVFDVVLDYFDNLRVLFIFAKCNEQVKHLLLMFYKSLIKKPNIQAIFVSDTKFDFLNAYTSINLQHLQIENLIQIARNELMKFRCTTITQEYLEHFVRFYNTPDDIKKAITELNKIKNKTQINLPPLPSLLNTNI